jgi:hypothetical protein
MALDLIFGKTQANWALGNASPIVDGVPHPEPLTAEQKEDLRTYLRHLPPVRASVEKDTERWATELRKSFGKVRDEARTGNPKSLARWNEFVAWTNKIQARALKNDTNALFQLRAINKTELFNPRFRVAG